MPSSYFTDTKNMYFIISLRLSEVHILEQNAAYDSLSESSWPAAGTTGMSFQPKMGKDRMTKDLLLKLMDEDWRVSFRKGMECFFYFLLMFQGKGQMTSYPVHFHDVRDSNKARWKEVEPPYAAVASLPSWITFTGCSDTRLFLITRSTYKTWIHHQPISAGSRWLNTPAHLDYSNSMLDFSVFDAAR